MDQIPYIEYENAAYIKVDGLWVFPRTYHAVGFWMQRRLNRKEKELKKGAIINELNHIKTALNYCIKKGSVETAGISAYALDKVNFIITSLLEKK